MAMMRMRMQQHQGMMRAGEPMSNMMSNGSGMEMMGPNGMMMRNSMGPNGPGMGMGGMPRTSGHPAMMQGPGNGMMHGMNMMGPGHPSHPAMQHGMANNMGGNRPPPPEYNMSQQVCNCILKMFIAVILLFTGRTLHDVRTNGSRSR